MDRTFNFKGKVQCFTRNQKCFVTAHKNQIIICSCMEKNQYFFCKFYPHFSLKTAGSFIVLHCSGQLLYFVLKNAKEIKKKKNTASPKS